MKPLAVAGDLAELERHEIIGGEIVEKAGPSGAHARAQIVIANGLFSSFDGVGGEERPGGWWFLTEVEVEIEPHEVYVPDIAGWRIERASECPRTKPVCIVPDWVCEILSPSTASHDVGHKKAAYHRARVANYWLVDPLNFWLTVLRWHDFGYQTVLAAGPGDVVRPEPFEAIELQVSKIFGQ